MDHREPRPPLPVRLWTSCRSLAAYVHRRFRPVRHRLGRQGAALLIFAVLDLGFAWSLLDGSPTGPSSIAAYRAARDLMPYGAWATVWALVGVICGVSAWLRHRQTAFAAAIAVKLFWAAMLYTTFVVYAVPRAWVGSLTWSALAVFVVIIAGLRERR